MTNKHELAYSKRWVSMFFIFIFVQIFGEKTMRTLNSFVRVISLFCAIVKLSQHQRCSASGLSCTPVVGCWTVCPRSATVKHSKIKSEEEQVLVPFCDHKPLQFGICHHQVPTNHYHVFFHDPYGTKLFVLFNSILTIS